MHYSVNVKNSEYACHIRSNLFCLLAGGWHGDGGLFFEIAVVWFMDYSYKLMSHHL
jgi:hypothetical protein